MSSLSESNQRRIVLLGKTGWGKSSAGNTIFGGGDEEFKIDSSANSETHKCETKTKIINGRKLTVVDTPGLFDTNIPEEELKPELVRCIVECAPGPHAFLIVLKVGKYTVHEEQVIAEIEECFSPEAFKYAIVLFTHGYQLKGRAIDDFVKTNKKLNELVKKCGGRCHVIDNELWNNSQQGQYSNQYQVAKLLNTIEEMMRENRGGCYTNEMLKAVMREIKVEIESITEESKGQKSPEEIKEQATENVWKRLLIKLTGIATGTIVAALLGVAGAVALVRSVLDKIPTVTELAAGGLGTAITVSIAGGVVAGGAIGGGMIGAAAAEDAETPGEAAKKAAEAVWEVGKYILEEGKGILDSVRSVSEGYSKLSLSEEKK